MSVIRVVVKTAIIVNVVITDSCYNENVAGIIKREDGLTCAYTHTYTHTHTHTHTRTDTHTHTHTHTHAHARTHAHTHTHRWGNTAKEAFYSLPI